MEGQFCIFLCYYNFSNLMLSTQFSWLWVQSVFYISCVFLSEPERKSVKLLVVHSCRTLWDPPDCSPPGSILVEFCPWNSPAKILEWVAVPISRGSSWPRDQTWVFHNAGTFFTIQATREAPSQYVVHSKFPANSPRMSMSFLCQYFLGCPSTGWLAPQV